MGTKNRILLVDASPLMFRVFVGPLQEFATAAGEPTGLRFGFLRALRSYEKALSPMKTVVVWDATRLDSGSVRASFGTAERGYKGNRKHTQGTAAKIWAGAEKVRELVVLTKYTQAWSPGYEADDVIASMARQLAPRGHEIVIVSPDRDFWQLYADPKVVGWDPKEKRYWGPADVIREFGLPPAHLHFWRAIHGDASDNLGGCGISPNEKQALKIWLTEIVDEQHENPDSYGEALQSASQDTDLLYRAYEMLYDRGDREDILRSNFELMRLRDPGEISIQKGINDPLQLEGLFKSLEMKSLIPRLAEFAGEVGAAEMI